MGDGIFTHGYGRFLNARWLVCSVADLRKEQNQNVHCIELEISESKKETAKAKDAALRQQGWTLFSKRQCPKWIDYA